MGRPILFTAALLLLTVGTAFGQDYEPTPDPETPAVDRTWYQDRDPVFFAGDLYYPAGPTVYFNRDTMVPAGAFDGVTLYADTTIEPYAVVLVPVSDRVMRPYKRVRPGYLLSRSANRNYYPSVEEEAESPAQAEIQEPPYAPRHHAAAPPPPAQPLAPGPEPFLIETARKPLDNLGMWVSFRGYRWTQSGEAVALAPSTMSVVGEYHGVRVYADPQTPYVIYIPSRANLVAPFRRAQ